MITVDLNFMKYLMPFHRKILLTFLTESEGRNLTKHTIHDKVDKTLMHTVVDDDDGGLESPFSGSYDPLESMKDGTFFCVDSSTNTVFHH
jgi:uncharacterized UPF0160 family protein